MLDAGRQIHDLWNDLQYNPKTGAMVKRGKDVFELLDEVPKKWKEGVDKISKSSIKNDAQRLIFSQKVDPYSESLKRNLYVHFASESKKYDDEVYSSSVFNNIELAAKTVGVNSSAADKVFEDIDKNTAEYGFRNGWDEKVIKKEQFQTKSAAHSGVIKKMTADENYFDAQGYFNKVKEQLTTDDKKSLHGILKISNARAEGRRYADKILAKNTDRKSGLAALDDEKIANVDIYDETKERLNRAYSQNEQAKEEFSRKNFKAGMRQIETTGKITPEIWDKMDSTERVNAMTYLSKLYKGIPIETDNVKYYELQMMSVENPAEFIKQDFEKYKPYIEPSKIREFTDLKAGMLKADKKATDTLNGYRTTASIVDDALRAMDIDLGAKANKKEANKIAEFRSIVDREIMQEQERTGKKIKNADVQEIVDILRIKARGTGFFGADRFYQVKEGQTVAIDIDDIPNYIRLQIESALKYMKKPVTDESILSLFNSRASELLR